MNEKFTKCKVYKYHDLLIHFVVQKTDCGCDIAGGPKNVAMPRSGHWPKRPLRTLPGSGDDHFINSFNYTFRYFKQFKHARQSLKKKKNNTDQMFNKLEQFSHS